MVYQDEKDVRKDIFLFSKTGGSNPKEQYEIAMHDIDKRINVWFQKFADNNKISLSEAKKILNTKELKNYKMDVDECIKKGMELKTNPQWIKQLKSASAIHHIERLDVLKMHTQNAIETLYSKQIGTIEGLAKNSFKDGYYHSIYSMQSKSGVGWAVNNINESKLSKTIVKPWAPDGKAFSDRIWGNKDKLINELHREITQGCITGKSSKEMAKNISDKLGVSKSNAERLVRTEATHFASAGQAESYQKTGVKQYQYLAGLDHTTCELCGDMDNQVFDVADFQEGITAPPLHPSCRCTTVPYYNDEFAEDEMRAARDENGKTVDVPADMMYSDWKAGFVRNKMSVKNAIKPEAVFLSSLENHDIIKLVKSYTDVTGILTSLGVSKVSNINKLNIDTAKHVTAGISDVKTTFPEININSVSVGEVGGAYGEYNTWLKKITFSGGKLNLDIAYAYSTGIHETAHALDDYMSVAYISSTEEYSKNAIKRAIKRLKINSKKAGALRLKIGGMRYAKNNAELFSRAFELVYTHREDVLSRTIVEIVKEDYHAIHAT